MNDSYGGPNRYKPAWKGKVLKVYKENTPNPSYGGRKENPGTWYSVNMGDVDFLGLTRYGLRPVSIRVFEKTLMLNL